MKVLAVCGSGMGTSMIMKMKVNQVLTKLGVQADVNSCSMGEAKSQLAGYDIVLASTHIASELTVGPNTILIGLQNLLDVNELEEKLKEKRDRIIMNLLDSLKENNSVLLKQSVNTWEEAVQVCMKPLLESKAINESYIKAIIERTKELGPFYVLAPGLAMPHERPEKGVNKNSFSFVTLENPVEFGNGQEVDILIGLAAVNSDIHNGEAIPQIVMLFEDDDIFDKFRGATKKEEIYEIIENIVGK